MWHILHILEWSCFLLLLYFYGVFLGSDSDIQLSPKKKWANITETVVSSRILLKLDAVPACILFSTVSWGLHRWLLDATLPSSGSDLRWTERSSIKKSINEVEIWFEPQFCWPFGVFPNQGFSRVWSFLPEPKGMSGRKSLISKTPCECMNTGWPECTVQYAPLFKRSCSKPMSSAESYHDLQITADDSTFTGKEGRWFPEISRMAAGWALTTNARKTEANPYSNTHRSNCCPFIIIITVFHKTFYIKGSKSGLGWWMSGHTRPSGTFKVSREWIPHVSCTSGRIIFCYAFYPSWG